MKLKCVTATGKSAVIDLEENDINLTSLRHAVASALGLPEDRLKLIKQGKTLIPDESLQLNEGDSIVAMIAPRPPPQKLRDMVDGGLEEDEDNILRLKLPSNAPRWQKQAVNICTRKLHIPEFIIVLILGIRLRSWLLFGGWLALSKLASVYEAGPPFLVITIIVMILLNLGTRTGGLSGYSLFNPGVQRLPGQVTAEQLDANIRRGNM